MKGYIMVTVSEAELDAWERARWEWAKTRAGRRGMATWCRHVCSAAAGVAVPSVGYVRRANDPHPKDPVTDCAAVVRAVKDLTGARRHGGAARTSEIIAQLENRAEGWSARTIARRLGEAVRAGLLATGPRGSYWVTERGMTGAAVEIAEAAPSVPASLEL